MCSESGSQFMALFKRLSPCTSKNLPTRKRRVGQGNGRYWGPGKLFLEFSRDWEDWIDKRDIDDVDLIKWERQKTLKTRLKSRDFYFGAAWEDPETGWLRHRSKRVGIVARKMGMITEKDRWGRLYPCTVLHVPDCQVIDIKTREKNGFTAMQVGSGLRKLHRTNIQLMGHFARAGVPPKEKIMQFRVTEDALLPLGTRILASHFRPGDWCDAKAKSRGKGFQGGMKRWGFHGLPASHGVSLAHRSLGSTGVGRQDPGRVKPGKKMPGRMGGNIVISRNLRVLKINNRDQLLYLIGNVPGPKKAWVKLTDAKLRYPFQAPRFPTHFPDRLPVYSHWNIRDPWKKTRLIDWESRFQEARKALAAAMKGEAGEDLDEDADDFGEGERPEGEDVLAATPTKQQKKV